MINILIGGDICPIGRNLPYFLSGNAEVLFGDLLPEFTGAHLSIVNLECPLIEKDMPILKCGPVMGVQSGCIKGLKNAQIDIVNLAQEIGTFDLSTQPYEDCCSLFVPKNPETKADLEEVLMIEKYLELQPLLDEAIEQTELVKFKYLDASVEKK